MLGGKNARRTPNGLNLRSLLAVTAFSATVLTGFAQSASAGSLPQRSAPLPEPNYSQQSSDQQWDGFFMGATLGYGFGDVSATGPSGNFNTDPEGIFGSVYVGHDWQFGNFILGLEGEWGLGDISGDDTVLATSVSTDLNWMAAVRARAGVLLGPALLVYATGGYAWADMDFQSRGATIYDVSENLSGYQVGGGAEFHIAPSWALRLDYIYTDLEDENITAGGVTHNFDPDFHLARAGLTLRF